MEGTVIVYLAYYTSWPEEVTIVGVYSTSLLAWEALRRSAAPPEGGSVVVPFTMNEEVERVASR